MSPEDTFSDNYAILKIDVLEVVLYLIFVINIVFPELRVFNEAR